MGVNMRNRPISEVFRGVYWWMVGGFAAAVISGLLLFWAEADRAFPNLFARIKFIGLLFAGLEHPVLPLWNPDARSRTGITRRSRRLRVRMAGFMSITWWVVVIAAGRLMAYTF